MRRHRSAAVLAFGLAIVSIVAGARAMQGPGAGAANAPVSSYLPVNEEDFRSVFARMRASKAEIQKRQRDLLDSRYDLSDRPVADVSMSQGKAIQGGVRAKLPTGVTWDALVKMTPDEIREKRDSALSFVGGVDVLVSRRVVEFLGPSLREDIVRGQLAEVELRAGDPEVAGGHRGDVLDPEFGEPLARHPVHRTHHGAVEARPLSR
jgi:hypothetical protein